ncbi:MAG: glycerophosphodiester phosphodiesterase family protein [Gammaproteobacteria bacterium]|nr:glycerophosphodiester phosphodiesterase family protein [Gammaproteobacteria bacterium]
MTPILVAHRGYAKKYPENSLLGLEQALLAGACMIELDVQMSADHQFVILHDSHFARTSGCIDSVFDLTINEVSKISVHEPERFANQFNPTPVPTLTQFINLLRQYPQATAFIEIKDESLERWGMDFVIERLQQVLMPCLEQCIIITFSYSALASVKKQGDYRIGWILTQFDDEHHQRAKNLQPDYLICNYKKISDEYRNTHQLWQDCGTWMLYDITEPGQAIDWAAYGVDLIETWDIGAMLQHPQLQQVACQHKVL